MPKFQAQCEALLLEYQAPWSSVKRVITLQTVWWSALHHLIDFLQVFLQVQAGKGHALRKPIERVLRAMSNQPDANVYNKMSCRIYQLAYFLLRGHLEALTYLIAALMSQLLVELPQSFNLTSSDI